LKTTNFNFGETIYLKESGRATDRQPLAAIL